MRKRLGPTDFLNLVGRLCQAFPTQPDRRRDPHEGPASGQSRLLQAPQSLTQQLRALAANFHKTSRAILKWAGDNNVDWH
jgi:hypothetical protein